MEDPEVKPTTTKEDAARIKETVRFYRIAENVAVRYKKGLACITLTGANPQWQSENIWLSIAQHRGQNAAMELTVDGVRHVKCRTCNMLRPLSEFKRGSREWCLGCLERKATSYKPDPLKEAARRATKKAIREGKVRGKPPACEDCGELDEYLTVHHIDYASPLEIEWLCTTCHGRRHRGNKRYYVFKSHVEARLAWI